jgi:hypothetical protein
MLPFKNVAWNMRELLANKDVFAFAQLHSNTKSLLSRRSHRLTAGPPGRRILHS